jgi:KDO2-lipid IV(A) lauroyltransferase
VTKPLSGRRRIRYRLEFVAVLLSLSIFRILSLDRASSFGGWMAGLIGPRLRKNLRAKANIMMIFPEWSERQVEEVLQGMWNNLGRVFGEYVHLKNIGLSGPDCRIELLGREHVERLNEDGMGGILVSGHMGNWELLSLASAQCGMPLLNLYRTANNPYVEKLLGQIRGMVGGVHHPKSIGGVRALIQGLKNDRHVGMLMDQKYNEGILVPFLGHGAMTTNAPAELAIRFNVPLVPARVERMSGAYFRVTVLPPIPLPDSGNLEIDKRCLTGEINKLFSSWIRDKPEQWLWLHRRWPEADKRI